MPIHFSLLTAGARVCAVQNAGTSGLVVRNRQHSGARRVMVANRVFSVTEQVYHPTTLAIGTIVERFPDIDFALVKLDEHVDYHDVTYTKLRRSKCQETRHPSICGSQTTRLVLP